MADVVEPAKTGRSRCRGCREKIEKGELRFGEEVPNPYADEEDAVAMHWFHVACGADRRPDRFTVALADFPGDVPHREEFVHIAQLGMANPNLALVLRAERSPTGRARCRQCREMIAKDSLRVAIEPEADANAMATAYFVHAACAPAKVGITGLFEKLDRVSKELTDSDRAELRTAMQET